MTEGYLLDTHVVAWAAVDVRRIGPNTQSILNDKANDIFLSSASIAEIAIKLAIGKFPTMNALRSHLPGLAELLGFTPLNVTPQHAAALVDLPRQHGDPFDRLLVTQAKIENLTLVTVDPVLASYGIPLLRGDT